MSKKNEVRKYLEEQPLFRERRNKDRGIVHLLYKKYPSLMECRRQGIMSTDTIVAILQEYTTMDRTWRQTLEKNEDLRGYDYEEKDKLEASKMEELGYPTPGSYGEGDAVMNPKDGVQKLLQFNGTE